MKYIDAEKLVAEINKRLMAVDLEALRNFGCHRVWAYNDVKDLITTLQQEQPDGLDEAAENYAWSLNEQFGGIEVGTSMESFKAGAEWQKEQMMKEAVEGTVFGRIPKYTQHKENEREVVNLQLVDFGDFANLKAGDKVKLVVLKSEEK